MVIRNTLSGLEYKTSRVSWERYLAANNGICPDPEFEEVINWVGSDHIRET